MGNMVAFSISHEHVGGLGDIDFNTIGRLHNEVDNKLRVSARSDIWIPEICDVSEVPGVLSSYYHHADGGADLLFSNQWMARLPYRLNLPAAMDAEIKARRATNQDQEAPHDSKTLMKALRGAVKAAPSKHPIHLKKSQVPPLSPNPFQSDFSVFGYLTDYYSDIEKDLRIMPAILDICLTGRVDERVFDRWSRLRYLGSFSAQTSCIVSMHRNSFSHFALPFRDLAIPANEQANMAENLASHRSIYADNAVELAGMNAIAQCFGYEVGRGLAPERSAQWEPK